MIIGETSISCCLPTPPKAFRKADELIKKTEQVGKFAEALGRQAVLSNLSKVEY
jgi:hypothetical protein